MTYMVKNMYNGMDGATKVPGFKKGMQAINLAAIFQARDIVLDAQNMSKAPFGAPEMPGNEQ